MITLFYGNQVYGEYTTLKQMYAAINVGDPVYQEGYFYQSSNKYTKWFRPDSTPCLIEEIPKELQMLVLVLNL